MAENQLTGGSGTVDTSMYPRFQPMPQPTNPLAPVNDLLNLQRNFQTAQQQQLELGMNRLKAVHQQLGAIAAKVDPKTMQPNATMDDINDVGEALQNAGVPKWQVQKEIEKFQGLTPAQIQDKARQHMAQIADHAATMGMAFGVPGDYHLGNVVQPTVRNPYTQAVGPTGGQPFPLGTTPGERASVAPYPNSQGGVDYLSGGQAAARTGTDPVYGTPLQKAFGPSPGQPAKEGFAGRPLTLEQDATALSSDRAEAAGTIKGVQAYMNAIPILEGMKNTDIGPGTAWQKQAKAFLIAQGWKGADQATDQRLELDKYLQQAVAGTPLANRSDFGANITKAASPNSDTQTRTAALELSKQIVAQARASAAAPAAFDDSRGPGGYLKHKSTFTQSQDMNAYKLDMMPEADRVSLVRKNAQLLQSGTPQQRIAAKRFFDSLQAADAARTLNLGPGQ